MIQFVKLATLLMPVARNCQKVILQFLKICIFNPYLLCLIIFISLLVMDDDCDVLSLAIDSVEKDIDQEAHNGAKVVKSPSNNHLDDLNQFIPEAQACNSDLEHKKTKKIRSLVGIDLCFEDKSDSHEVEKLFVKEIKNDLLQEKSVVHTGDTDSSDDEDNKYFEEIKYDSFGKFIKNKLKNTESQSLKGHQDLSWKKSANSSVTASVLNKVTSKETKIDVSADPIFGIRIVNPLVSSQNIKEKMIGRTPIGFAKIKSHVSHGDLNNDWVIAAVIVRKLPPRVSQNGNNYSSWILSDLKNDLKTVFLFLFGKAHQDLWKTSAGTVLAILNPSVLNDKKSSEYEAKLSIKSPDQVMIWGRSKDLGQCKAIKKNGEICGAFVNSYLCEVCVYHVKQEYNKCNSRSEFNSPGNVNLRNKVLGKNEIFYGGKSFVAVPPSGRKKKVTTKDVSRLKGLGANIIKVPEVVSVPNLQRSNEILKLLPSVKNPLNNTKSSDKNRLNQLSTSNTKVPEKLSLTNNCNLKSEQPEIKVSTLKSPSSENNSILKSIVPGIKLPTLSNPESEFQFHEKCNNNARKLSNSSVLVTSTEKITASYKKNNKTNLQKRFNSLVNMQIEIKEEERKGLLNLDVPAVNSDKLVMKHTDEKHSLEATVISKDYGNSCTTYSNDMKKRISNCKKPGKKNSTFTDENNKIDYQSPKCIDNYESTLDTLNTPKRNSIKQEKVNVTNPPNSSMSKAKMKALLYVKAKGPISKGNPNKEKIEGKCTGVKRPFPSDEEDGETKKSVLSERFIQLMNQKSLHEDLIELREYEQELEYFEKMEKKDRLEEKMLNTYKVDCKAVKCLKCNYLWFSAADACKAEGHPIKVIDAIKRFFKCGHCGNRTISLTIIPLLPCKKCSSTNWVRTGMMREKVAKIDSLSIRGGEQKFVNSVITNASLNLLVPDE